MTTDNPEMAALKQDQIEIDLPCSRCTYNLKGLQRSGNCPECGQAIELTLSFGLHSADPAWLKYQSVTMLLLASLAITPPYAYFHPWYGYSLRLVQAIVGLVGVWRLTRPDPADLFERDGPWRRGLLAVGIAYVITSVLMPDDRYESIAATVSAVSARYLSLVVLWGLALLMIWRMANRTGDVFLKQHAKLCLWAQPAVTLLMPVFWLVFPDPREVGMIISLLVSWIGSITTIVTVLLLGRMFEVLCRVSDIPRPTPPHLSLPEPCEATSYPLPPASLKSPAPGPSSAAP